MRLESTNSVRRIRETESRMGSGGAMGAGNVRAWLLWILLMLLCAPTLHAKPAENPAPESTHAIDSSSIESSESNSAESNSTESNLAESAIPQEPPKVRKHKTLDPRALDSSTYVESSRKKQWLFGDILHPYVGLGFMGASSNSTHVRQSMSKEVATCPNQLCSGDTTSASYAGMFSSGMEVELGAEYFFDRFHILGVRLFGQMASRNGSLGEKIAGSDKRDTSTNNLQEAYQICLDRNTAWGNPTYDKDGNMTAPAPQEAQNKCGILIMGSSTDPNLPNTKVEDSFTFQKTPDAAQIAPQDGRYLSFALGLDAMLNLPIDYALKRWAGFYLGDGFFAKRLTYLKLGVFVGGGAEFARFSQGDPQNKTWQNTAAAQGKPSNLNDAFFAAGSGGFLRYGVSMYFTRFARVSFGYKHSYYPIAQERWYGYDGAQFDSGAPDNIGAVRPDDPWSETLLRQRYVSTKGKEWFLQFALSF